MALCGSTRIVMPSCSITLSLSRFSSNVNPYWKPEQPPPCTKTRSGLPSESGIVWAKYLTFATAASVKESIGLGAVIGVGVDSSGRRAPSALGRLFDVFRRRREKAVDRFPGHRDVLCRGDEGDSFLVDLE